MIEPLAAAYGTTSFRQTILVHIVTDIGPGWGECVALNQPLYSPDWSNGEYNLLKELLAPTILSVNSDIAPEDVESILRPYKQHHTSKAAIEMAVLDAQLRAEGRSVAEYFNATVDSVACSIVIGLLEGDALVRSVKRYLEYGYKALKLKIKPGMDVERVDLVKAEFPDLPIRVDANGSYEWENPEHRKVLDALDERNLLLIEQPFPPDRAFPFREYRRNYRTPIALDESIVSWSRALNALEDELCDVLIIKPAMLGGYLLSRRLQLEAQKRGIPTMIGGMIETAIARSANLALAAIGDNTDYPAEISPDGRWFNDRMNLHPINMVDGRIEVPTEPGVGGDLDWAVLDRLTRRFHVSRGGVSATNPYRD